MRARSASTSRGSECRQTEKTPPRQRIEAVLDQRSQPVPIDVVGTLAGFLEDRGLDPEYIGNRGAHLLGKSTDAAERAPGLLGSREVDAFELKAWPPRRFTALLRREGEIEACGESMCLRCRGLTTDRVAPPASSTWLSTATPTMASVRCGASPRARSLAPTIPL